MRSSAIGQLLVETHAPLKRASRLLERHVPQIRAAWHKKLQAAGFRDEQIEAVSPLIRSGLAEWLGNRDFSSYRSLLEQHAEQFEDKGISEAQLTLAMGIYLECALPYIKGPKAKELTDAVVRFTTVTQALLLSAHAEHRAGALRKIQEQERHSLSRDLHDDIGHNLLVLKLYLEMMNMDLNKGDVTNLGSKLQEALALVSNALDSVRRLMLDLGPAMLSQFGFLRAVRVYARQFTLRTGIDVQVVESGIPESLDSNQETALYRVVQGALSNILQHSQAKNVKLTIGATKRTIVMSIEDDGTGFDVTNKLRQRAFGIRAMRERVEMLGGRFHIDSIQARSGTRRRGTRIEIDLPVENMGGK